MNNHFYSDGSCSESRLMIFAVFDQWVLNYKNEYWKKFEISKHVAQYHQLFWIIAPGHLNHIRY